MIKSGMQKFMQMVDDRVERFGWTSIFVPADDGKPSYAYTVGFSEAGKTDFLLVGEDHCVGCFLFYRLGELSDQDLIPGAGRVKEILHHIDVELTEVAEEQAKDLALVAVERLRGRKLRMLQLVVPDRLDQMTSGSSLADEEELSQIAHRALMN